MPPVPPIAAKSWLLLDYQTRYVIASHDPEERVEPASLTKLMSAYLVFSALEQKQITLAQTAAGVDAGLEDAGLTHVHRAEQAGDGG